MRPYAFHRPGLHICREGLVESHGECELDAGRWETSKQVVKEQVLTCRSTVRLAHAYVS